MMQALSISDIAQMESLHAQAFHRPWPASDFQTHIENPFDDVLGWVEDGQVLGFVVMRVQDDQAEVLTIIVDAKQQGKGLGAKILAAGERECAKQGADIVFLEVAKDTPAAIRLYQKTGYHQCGTRRGYYRREKGRVDALLFSKKI